MSKRKTRQKKMKRQVRALIEYSASLEAKNREMHRDNESLIAHSGINELNSLLDSTLVSLGITYGVPEFEEGENGENGKVIGYRMEIPMPRVALLKKHLVKAEKIESKDGEPMLRIGVILLDDTVV